MLALDVLLLLMIAVCIVYCWILNQRIRDLHNSRVEFARMIKEFDAAVIKAENCISELSLLSLKATDNIREAASESDLVVQELKTIYEIGNNLGEKLEQSISDARKQLELSIAKQSKPRKKKVAASETAQATHNNDEIFSYSAEGYAETDEGVYSEEELLPEHRSLLENVLSKITTHRHKGTLDQTSYYDSLRKLSVRK